MLYLEYQNLSKLIHLDPLNLEMRLGIFSLFSFQVSCFVRDFTKCYRYNRIVIF